MKKLLSHLILFFMVGVVNCQPVNQLISSGGGSGESGGYRIDYSIGDFVTESYHGLPNWVTQGFQQSSRMSLQGQVNYSSSNNTPLRNTTLSLKQGNQIINTCQTTNQGRFIMVDLEAGTYTLTGSTMLSWGGVNSIDALQTLKHYLQVISLTGLPWQAADVDGSTIINSTDAMRIARRFIGQISSFPIGDWIFEQKQVILTNPSVLNQNLKAICVGDVNESYVPLSK